MSFLYTRLAVVGGFFTLTPAMMMFFSSDDMVSILGKM